MAIKAIIWDFDGTLASSLEGIAASMKETLQSFGYPAPTMEQVRSTVGLTIEESILRLTHGAFPDDRMPEIVAKFRGLHLSNAAPLTTLFPGVQHVLSMLQGRGITSVIASNKGRTGLQQLLNQLEIETFFAVTLSVEDVIYRKPDARLYSQHISPLLKGLHPEEVVVVGDTESDIRFASAAGIRACWAKYGYGDRAICRALHPAYTLESISDMVAVIEQNETSAA
jgi:phosphoglycolate phosphatase